MEQKLQIIDQRYKIIKSLGGGLSGEVFLVQDDEGKKALKFLKRVQLGLSREEALMNFKNEFSILKELNHPHVARILDFGFDEKLNKYYFTSEFISGSELHVACAGQPIEVIEKLLLQVLRALNYLHARGVYHFDIKPQNILVAMNNGVPEVAKIIDFGLAGFASPRKKVGTPAYMAPEVILGQPLDGRADLYSMGVLIYKIFTEENPFSGKGLKETMDNHLHLNPPPLVSLNKNVPAYWDHIVSRLLEKLPSKRYAQASIVIRDLNFISGKKIEVETQDTKLSYLPEKGTLIGRAEEWSLFTNLFEKVFDTDSEQPEKLIVVTGDKGTGKTRILSEMKHFSQLRNVPVKSLKQLEIETERAGKYLLTIDDEKIGFDKVNIILQKTISDRCIIVWATERAPFHVSGSVFIRLGNYTKEQLKDYLESVTGLGQAPMRLIEEVYRRTLGNPLFVSEFVKSLLQSDLLCDSTGKWGATTFEDIQIDFEKILVPQNLEEMVLGRVQELSPDEQDLLIWMALSGESISINDLRSLHKKENVESWILSLINKNFIEKTSREHHYYFKNVLYAGIIEKSLSDAERKSRNDEFALMLSKDPGQERVYLSHLSLGSDPEIARQALQKLAAYYIEDRQYKLAAEQLKKLLHISEENVSLRWQAGLDLGMCLVEIGNSLEAQAVYEDLLSRMAEASSVIKKEDRLRVFYQLIWIAIKNTEFDKAENLLSRAKNEGKTGEKNSSIQDIILKNYEGWILYLRGKCDEAEEILLESQKFWEDKLTPEEQKQVSNNRLFELYIFKQDLVKAKNVCERNVRVLQKLESPKELALNYYALGDIFYRMMVFDGDKSEMLLSRCVDAFERAEKVAKKSNHQRLIIAVYNGMGTAYFYRKNYDKATEYYERALLVARKSEDLETASVLSLNLGNLAKIATKLLDSYSYVVYAINTLENLPHKRAHNWMILWQCYVELSEIHRLQGDLVKAHAVIDKASSISTDQDFLKSHISSEHLERAKIFQCEGKKEEFEKSLQLARDTASNNYHREAIKSFTEEADKKSKTDKENQEKLELKVMSEENQTNAHHDLKTIIQINKFINNEIDITQLLNMVLNYAIELSNAEAGFVLLLDEHGEFQVSSSRNKNEADIEKISLSIAKTAIETGEIINSSDALSDQRFDSSESVVLNELKSVLCLPIRSRNKSLGVFYLDNRFRVNAFSLCNVTLLNAFCDQVGIALENAKLIAELKESKKNLENKLSKTSEELAEVKEILQAESATYKSRYSYKQIVSQSATMQSLFKILDKITETNLSVFLHGESGTGKELVAKALHYNNSSRSSKRFIAINCGAIPAQLMESELFGHKSGSFTGASGDKKGLFEEANGGTLFLDEIGDLDMHLQVKLLRVLQEGEVQKIGDTRSIKVDVRVVSASHRDMEQMVKQKQFREDLYYRLCQIKVSIPPLRERLEDIPLLVNHFIEKFKTQNKVTDPIEVPASFMKALLAHSWSGNVRELENFILVACALRDGSHLSLENLPSHFAVKSIEDDAKEVSKINCNLADHKFDIFIDEKNPYDYQKTWDEYEALIIAKCYESCGRKKMAAAQALDLSHSTLYKKVAEMNLDDDANPLYADPFVYDSGHTLRSYVSLVFQAALKFHDGRPYAAIRQLKVSQGFFYKILKTFEARNSETTVKI